MYSSAQSCTVVRAENDVNNISDASNKSDITGSSPQHGPEKVSPYTQKPPNIPDALPQALKDLMRENSVDEFEIRNLVANKGFYPLETPITNYDTNFINGALIAEWDKLWPLIRNERDLPF